MSSCIDREAFEKLISFVPTETSTLTKATIDECCQLFLEDRHFDVLAKLEGLLEELTRLEQEILVKAKTETESDSTTETGASSLSVGLLRTFIENSPLRQTSQRKVHECKFLCDDIEEMKSWTPTTKINEKGYGTYYRAEPGKTAHSFKVIGEVAESVLHVASVIMELDLYTEWFPFCCFAQMQGEVTRFHKSSQFVVQLPWPMTNREVFLVGYGVDDLQHRKRIIITSRSVPDDEPLPQEIRRPAVMKGNTRIPVEVGGFVIEALSPKCCKVSFIMNVDPKIPHVPQWLVNWVSGKMIWVLLYQMDKAAKRAGTSTGKYAERRRQRPDIYEHFQSRAVEVFAHHFPGEPIPTLDGDVVLAGA